MKKGNRIAAIFAAAAVAWLSATSAHAAAISVFAARVGAVDASALAKFYEAAFGLKELRRLKLTTGLEVMLGFGDTTAGAKANRGTEVLVNHRPSDAIKDPIPHLLLRVNHMDATVKAIKANGGTMEREPFKLNDRITIAIARDPVGNLVEMLQMSPGAGG